MPFGCHFNFVCKIIKPLTLALVLAGSQASADMIMLIDTLEKGGAITAQDAEALRVGEAATVRPSASAVTDLKVRGRIHAQIGHVSAENDDDQESYNTIELRRVRLGLRGTFPSEVRAQLEANLVPGAAKLSMRSAFLQWRKYKPAYIKLGLDKPTTSLEENTSSSEILTVERSYINNLVAAPSPLNGLVLDGVYGMVYYSLGAYTDTVNTNEVNNEPVYMQNAALGLSLGELLGQGEFKLQVTHMASDDPNGKIGGGLEQANVVGLQYLQNLLGVQAEYFLGGPEDSKVSGWYFMPSYNLSESNQVVLRVEQAKSEEDGGLSVAKQRYTSNVPQIVQGAQSGDAYQAVYLGWNHYIGGHGHKLMAGVEAATLQNTEAGDLQSTSVYAAWRVLF